MARRPTLAARDIRRILGNAGFALKRTTGGHEHWEGYVDGKRRLVTIDPKLSPFTSRSRVLNRMIRQSGLGKSGFYSLPWSG